MTDVAVIALIALVLDALVVGYMIGKDNHSHDEHTKR